MSDFYTCQWVNCDFLADFKCSCQYYSCATHSEEHMNNLPDHQRTLLLLSLLPQDQVGLNATEDALKHRMKALISQIVSEKDEKLENLLRRIRVVEEEFSQEIERCLRRHDSLLKVLRKPRKEGLFP